MIVRQDRDGSWILINQGDHAKLSGMLAAHWGNAQFPQPDHRESFVRGVSFHDCGWLTYEASPIFPPGAAAPPNFQAVPLDSKQLWGFQNGLDWLWSVDAYAGLLASRHRTGLWQRRYDATLYPPPPKPRVLGDDVKDFIARNEARQDEALKDLDAEAFEANYQLLQVLDLLSLYVCTSELKPDRIDYQPGSGPAVSLTLAPLDDSTIAVDPYPFDADSVVATYVFRRLRMEGIETEEQFRLAYFGAPLETRAFTFRRAPAQG